MREQKPHFLSRVEIGTIAASALAIVFGLAYAGPTPHMIGSVFGLAPDQTVRISIASNDFAAVRGATTDPCFAQLKVFAADGSVVMETAYSKIQQSYAVIRDLKYAEVVVAPILKSTGVDFTNRVQLRVASYLSPTDLNFSKIELGEHKVGGCMGDLKMLKLSVEVFDDASGKTAFMVPTDQVSSFAQ